MDTELTGKNAVVLAASRGLGRAIASALAAEGANVAICARTGDDIHDLAEEIAYDHGVKTYSMQADVSDAKLLSGFIDGAAKSFGGIDVLVTNCGGPSAGSFSDFDDDAWLEAFNLVLMSVVRSVRSALPHMEGRKDPSITCIISSSARVPIDGLLLSNVLRPAIVGLAKSLSLELASKGVRVNCLAPGRIDTERVRELDEITAEKTGSDLETVLEERKRSIPFGRYGEPEELARCAVFLASKGASYISGQSVFVDGGATRSL
jgi:3-oxoacyl-[acyl-carrier protein] reductase